MNETFYGPFYHLDSPPFHITPDPALLFATDTHQQALGAIEYGIAAGKGFIVVTGEVGVGKTTVLRAVLDRLPKETSRIIYLFNPNLTIAHLYVAILEGLDTHARGGTDPAETVQRLHHALLDCHKRDVQVILAVDEAQNMPEATLESLRILSNLETATSKLLQIILVGQPELEETLRRHSLRQLVQRVAVRARIAPLSFQQSCRYVQHRLVCAGRPTEPPLFTVPALWYLAFRARGTPRTLNIFCDNALINGYGHAAERLSLRLVCESLRPLQARPRLLRRALGWAAAVIVLAALGGEFFHGGRSNMTNVSQLAAAVPVRSIASDAAPTENLLPPAQSAVAVPPNVSWPVAGHDPIAAADANAAVTVGIVPPANSALAANTASAASQATRAPTAAHETARLSGGSAKKWLVQSGDTVIKLCRETYGACEPAKLREIFMFNPKINAKGAIRPGDVIVLPDQGTASLPN